MTDVYLLCACTTYAECNKLVLHVGVKSGFDAIKSVFFKLEQSHCVSYIYDLQFVKRGGLI